MLLISEWVKNVSVRINNEQQNTKEFIINSKQWCLFNSTASYAHKVLIYNRIKKGSFVLYYVISNKQLKKIKYIAEYIKFFTICCKVSLEVLLLLSVIWNGQH